MSSTPPEADPQAWLALNEYSVIQRYPTATPRQRNLDPLVKNVRELLVAARALVVVP